MNKPVKPPTPPAQYLMRQLAAVVTEKSNDNTKPRVLNIGAAQKIFIEQYLNDNNVNFTGDRIDVVDCKVDVPSVDKCWQSSVEDMKPVDPDQYSAAFANWVLEHVPDLQKASSEICRVLKPGGKFITTIPNINAPEFYLAKVTPLWFHQLIRGHSHAYETHYSYKSIDDLTSIFEKSGLNCSEVKYFPCVEFYLERIASILGTVGRAYDKVIEMLSIESMMGSVCITFVKPG